MFGGGRGGGIDPSQMQQAMEQMGIDLEDVDADEVIIRTGDEELYFDDAEVQLMEAQGKETYQVVGSPETRPAGSGAGGSGEAGPAEGDAADATDHGDEGVPDDDVELVAMRAGVDEETAREALEAEDGDLAAAVDRLE